ncbi:MAG: MFS transporter [Actinomycetia bacterium]|nr:MFS transporter [Actinomycetes bacterium]
MTDVTTTPKAPRLFYGWTIVGTVFFILAVTSGLGFYNASVILSAATEELDVSVGAVSGATARFFGISGLTGFALSRQMETRDLRLFYVAGGILGAVALAGLRWVDTVALLYLFFALFGIGFALAGLVPGTTLVTRWFDRRRSVALSIASTGLSLGGIAVTPVAAWLIDRRGLGGAGPILALIWIVGVIPIGVLLIRSRPSDKGLEPDGRPATPQPATITTTPPPTDPTRPAADTITAARAGVATKPPGATFAVAIRTRFFIMMSITYALIFFAQVGGLAHLFNLATERADKTTAGTALSLLAFTSVIGRLLGGFVVLRIPTKVLSVALTLFQGVALLALANAFSSRAIIASAVLLGISVGNLLMLQPLLLAEAFGVAEYGRIYSLNQLMGTIGVGGGPFVLGLVHDAFDYRTAFIVAAAASLVGFVTFIAAGPTSRALALWAR